MPLLDIKQVHPSNSTSGTDSGSNDKTGGWRKKNALYRLGKGRWEGKSRIVRVFSSKERERRSPSSMAVLATTQTTLNEINLNF